MTVFKSIRRTVGFAVVCTIAIGVFNNIPSKRHVTNGTVEVCGKKSTLTSEIVSSKLRDIGELSAQELEMSGEIRYEDDGIKYLNKSKFTVNYEATVKAGINLNEVRITAVDNDNFKIYVSMPDAEIQTVSIDPDSLEIVEQQFKLIKNGEKEEMIVVIQDAENEVLMKAEESDIIAKATRSAEKRISEFLEYGFPEYQVAFERI